jgi:anti-sigma-K factor RskA
VAILIVVVLFAVPRFIGTDTPSYVAEIAGENGGLIVQVQFDPVAANLDFHRTAGTVKDGRAQELWLIADGATAPVPLGVLPITQKGVVHVPEALRAKMIGGTLAISDEPLGGSPTGAPTGVVLAYGVVVSF